MASSSYAARSYRATGLVLRTQPLGEADRIITLLTAERGIIRAVAKGVRKTKSRFGASVEPFSLVDVQLVQSRSLDILSQSQTRSPLGVFLSTDYQNYTCACAIAETAERLTSVETGDSHTQFRLCFGALNTLAHAQHDALSVLYAYLVQALAEAGWAPGFSDCVRCGAPGPHPYLHVVAGGVCCQDCRPAGSTHPRRETISYLQALTVPDWSIIDQADAAVVSEAGRFINNFVHYHLERHIKSLSHLEYH